MRRLAFLSVTCGLLLAGQVWTMPAQAGAIPVPALVADIGIVPAAHAGKSAFKRCMRAKYGPHYYRGVKRAHRYFMAQACGG